MADVFTVLREDHLDVEHMLNRLETQAASGPLDEQDRVERKLLVERLVMELSKHEAVEEQLFWPVVRDALPDGDMLANTAINQENEGKSVLQRLEAMRTPSGEFERLLAGFIPDAREHIEYEQTQVWPKLREALTPEQAEDLGAKISKAKLFAPTRPHPHTPAKPGMLKTAGMAAAATDRLRDKLTGRGKVAHHAHH
jgi:hemerythrin-like domain-containing protein